MTSLLDQVKNEDFNNLESSQNFHKISNGELKEILDYVKTSKNFSHFVYVNPVNDEGSVEKNSITSLEESWVFVQSPTEHTSDSLTESVVVPQRPGFFDDWPSFGVKDKMAVVMRTTGTAMFYGYLVGASAALDSLYRIAERPLVAAGLSALTTMVAWLSPQLFLRVIGYVVVGGVVGAATVATPVFVIGTTGVFVSASIYHSYILAKRGITTVIAHN